MQPTIIFSLNAHIRIGQRCLNNRKISHHLTEKIIVILLPRQRGWANIKATRETKDGSNRMFKTSISDVATEVDVNIFYWYSSAVSELQCKRELMWTKQNKNTDRFCSMHISNAVVLIKMSFYKHWSCLPGSGSTLWLLLSCDPTDKTHFKMQFHQFVVCETREQVKMFKCQH